jgi:hypothetical protein
MVPVFVSLNSLVYNSHRFFALFLYSLRAIARVRYLEEAIRRLREGKVSKKPSRQSVPRASCRETWMHNEMVHSELAP